VEAGAGSDGRCVALGASAICRPSAGLCDVEERCDGASPACPLDALRLGGEVCRPAAGICDAEESCTGRGAACPEDLLLSAATTCRPAAGPCDVPESCPGLAVTCPRDVFATRDTTCGGGGEVCSGTHPQCPLSLRAGCGCSAGSETFPAVAALLLVAAKCRRRPRRYSP